MDLKTASVIVTVQLVRLLASPVAVDSLEYVLQRKTEPVQKEWSHCVQVEKEGKDLEDQGGHMVDQEEKELEVQKVVQEEKDLVGQEDPKADLVEKDWKVDLAEKDREVVRAEKDQKVDLAEKVQEERDQEDPKVDLAGKDREVDLAEKDRKVDLAEKDLKVDLAGKVLEEKDLVEKEEKDKEVKEGS